MEVKNGRLLAFAEIMSYLCIVIERLTPNELPNVSPLNKSTKSVSIINNIRYGKVRLLQECKRGH